MSSLLLIGLMTALPACSQGQSQQAYTETADTTIADITSTTDAPPPPAAPRYTSGADIEITKEYAFEKYILEDTYAYKDTTRQIKWDVIRDSLAVVERSMHRNERWGVIQNYKNMNGEAKAVRTWHRNEYKLLSDSLGIARYQSVPLYLPIDTVTPRRYGRDGTPIHLIDSIGSYYKLVLIDSDEEWLVPRRYVRLLPHNHTFSHAVAIDVTDQNIVFMKRTEEGKWTALSTNPATTGKHNPPYGHETPPGIFMIQQKKSKMYYLKDGTNTIAGYAPWASRFTNGAYIHGVPTNNPDGAIIEYSRTLGTTPRSHMCVRNASSHAKYIYDEAPTLSTIVIIIE